MSKSLDYVFLVLALLAAVGEILFLISPTAFPVLQPIALVMLVACGIYFFARPSIRKNAPRSSESVASPSATLSSKTEEQDMVYRYMAARYGIGYDLLDISCDLHYDGSATIKRKVTVKAFSRMDGLETSLLIPETSEPGTWSEKSRIRVTSAPEQNYIVSLGSFKRIEKKQFAQIVFAPELAEGKSLTFILTEELFPGIFAVGLSDKDIDKLNERDYFGWNIDRPTRILHLKVLFPARVRPKVFGTLVQYSLAFSDIQKARYQYEEQKRLREPSLSEIGEERYVLALDVEYPMVGLVYVLYWLPVSKKDEIPDDYTSYEISLQNLLPQFDEGHVEYTLMRDLAHRLTDNIARSRLYGDSESLRNERAEIVRELDRHAQSACNCSFLDLCR